MTRTQQQHWLELLNQAFIKHKTGYRRTLNHIQLNTVIVEHISDSSLSPVFISRQTGHTRRNLDTKLKLIIGKTVYQYLTGCRVLLADDCLHRGWSKKDIVAGIGFKSMRQFYSQYQSLFDVAPGQEKKQWH